MTAGTNSAGRIAELRKEMYRLKGRAARARVTESVKRRQAVQDEADVRFLAREIESMGGKVRR